MSTNNRHLIFDVEYDTTTVDRETLFSVFIKIMFGHQPRQSLVIKRRFGDRHLT